MNRRGSALILVYMVTTVLTILTIAFFSSHTSESLIIKKYSKSTRAFWLAEAGIARGLWELKYGQGEWSDWEGSAASRLLQASLGSSGDYDVSITFPDYPSLRTANIVAKGYYPNRQEIDKLTRIVDTEATQGAFFSFAAFGQRAVYLRGNIWTDSYDSTKGRYDSINNKAENGDLGTNGTGIGDITLFGNATIEGDVSTGAGGTIEKRGSVTISGWETHENDIDLEPVRVSRDLSGLHSGGRLVVRRDRIVTLGPGDYKFASITVKDNGRLAITGTARIYLTGDTALRITDNGRFVTPSSGQIIIYTDGDAFIGGAGIDNQSYSPGNLLLYGTGDSLSRTIEINSGDEREINFYGSIYAPNASISLVDNVKIYGSIVGRRLTAFGNTRLHYDEALNNILLPGTEYNIGSWQEIKQ